MNNLNIRTAIITGGTSGIGFYSAMGIEKAGFKVIITGRNIERGKAAEKSIIHETKNRNIKFIVGDISSIRKIDMLTKSILEQTNEIDVLINNAGYFGDTYQKTEDGLEKHFAINVLGPYRLTHNLLPLLKVAKKARVINVTGGDKPASIDPDNLQAEKGFRGLMTFKHSKSVLESVSMVLAEELKSYNISVNIVFPGRASTATTKSLTLKSLPGLMKIMFPLMKLFFREDNGKSALKAAKSTIWAATSTELNNVSGKYFDANCKKQSVHKTARNSQIQSHIIQTIKSSF